jgi:class 3 adenylate cyclase/tetratricopeptide (TPR) repeat protein
LVASTELSTRLDVEDYHSIVRAYDKAVGDVVVRFEGHTAQYQGDGIVAYFGWPRAHGDDAERAIRAGLEAIEAIHKINRDLPEQTRIAVRVGIHTGPVVVGLAGVGARREITAYGETPNIASRAQSAAPPNGVVITEATNRLVRGVFILEPLGLRTFKDIAEPLTLYQVRRIAGVRNRLLRAANLTPFVGREHEMRTLAARWELVEEGEGQVVLITGEPGIGKSRLVDQFRTSLGTSAHSWLECFCSPFNLNTPFAPVIDVLGTASAWRGNETPKERLKVLETGLRDAGLKLDEALPLVAEILNLAVSDRYPQLVAPPELKRKRLIATLTQWLFSLARMQPVVLVLEDVQWADPSTLEFQQQVVEQSASAALMLIYTARPEFRAPWAPRSTHAHLVLTRLSRKQTHELVRLAAIQTPLNEQTVQLVAERADGVPLFAEELAQVVAMGSGTPSLGPEIPATLADSLMARIDSLGEAKEIAQIASVVGRQFSYGMLREVAARPEEELQSALTRLSDSQLIHSRGSIPDATYLFKHVLMRDAAYGSLLITRRRELHRAVARALSEKFVQRNEIEPEILAHHLTEAGGGEAATAAWQRAGDRSSAQGSFVEAANHYQKAINVLRTLVQSTARDQREIALLMSLGATLSATKGFAAEEVATAYKRVGELSISMGRDSPSVVLGLWQTYLNRGQVTQARDFAERTLKIAERGSSSLAKCWAHFALGATQLHLGNLDDSLKSLRTAVDEYHEEDSRSRTFDPGVNAMSYLAVALVLSGFADQAAAMAERALRMARHLGKPSNIAFCSVNACAMHQLYGNPSGVLDVTRETAPLTRARGLEQLGSALAVYSGWAVAALGNPAEGADQIRRGIAGWLLHGQKLPHAWYLSLLAWAYGCASRFDDALEIVGDADSAIGELLMEKPIVMWTRADILRRSGALPEVLEDAWRQAAGSAHSLGMKLYDLRATKELAKLLGQRGDAVESKQILAPVLAGFTEGLNNADVIEAQRLVNSST